MITGFLSDGFARAAGGPPAQAAAAGLHGALLAVVPVTLLVAAIGLFGASMTIRKDAARMQEQLSSGGTFLMRTASCDGAATPARTEPTRKDRC